MKYDYNARWAGPTLASLANISLTASSNQGAIQAARRQAKKIGLPNTPFMLYKGNTLIHHGV